MPPSMRLRMTADEGQHATPPIRHTETKQVCFSGLPTGPAGAPRRDDCLHV